MRTPHTADSPRLTRPALRPGTTISWSAEGAAVIGTRPGLRVTADASELFRLVARVRAMDGGRTWDEVTGEIPENLLTALAEAGSVIEAAGIGSQHAAAHVVDCCRARVVDGDVDDAVALAVARQRSTVALAGDEQMCDAAEELVRATGVRVLRDLRPGSRPAVAITLKHSDHDLLSLNAATADQWLRSGVPHVCASVSGTRALIGPLTVPGATPCARCVVGQLRQARGLTESEIDDIHCNHNRPARSPETVALCLGLAIGRALLFIDAMAPTGLADSLIIDSSGRVELLQTSAQPNCGCQCLPSVA